MNNVEGHYINEKLQKFVELIGTNDIRNLLRNIIKENKRIARMEASKNFLLKCRQFGLIPRFISDTSNNTMNLFKDNQAAKDECSTINYEYHRRILNVYIDHSIRTLIDAKKLKKRLCDQCMNFQLNGFSIDELFDTLSEQLKVYVEYYTSGKMMKFTKIKNKFLSENNLESDQKWIINLTDITVPDEVKWVLSLGGKFALPVTLNQKLLFHTISNVEDQLKLINEDRTKDIIRAKVANILTNHQHQQKRGSKPTAIDRWIIQTHEETKKFLKNNNHVIVVHTS